MQPLDTYTIGSYKVEIFSDDCPESPREWDNVGKLICFHRNYSLGDKHSLSQDQAREEFENAPVGFLVRAYEHGGIVLSYNANNYPFNCPWDSYYVGYHYVTNESIEKESPAKDRQKQIEWAKEILVSELEVYNQYLTGNVYYYTITDQMGTVVDSCGGMYGLGYTRKEIASIVAYEQEKIQPYAYA